jgi:hypothetical protein
MSAAASYSSKTPGMSAVRNLPNDRNVHLERGFQFALYRLLATCHAARRTSTTRGSSGLPPSGLTPNNGSSSRLRSGLDVGGAMRTRAVLAAPTITLAVATTTPATAGEEGAGRIAWSPVHRHGLQWIADRLREPGRGGLRRLTDPGPGTPVISPDGSQVVVDRWQSACLLEQHPRGVSCVS